MGKSKFISIVSQELGSDVDDTKSKKKAIKKLIEKLKKRRENLKKEYKIVKEKELKEDIQNSLYIIKKQIKKGEKLLEK